MSAFYKDRCFQIVDAHMHTFPDKIAQGAVSKLEKISGLTPVTNGTVGDTLEKMEGWGVDGAVLLNIATTPKQQTTINNCAKTLNDSWPDRLAACGSVHFLSEDALTELERIKALGLPAVKLHPDYQGFMIDDKRLFPIYEACAALDLPVIFHAGWDCYSPDLIHAPPAASRKVLTLFPALKVVLAHFGGIKCWDEVETYLIGQNVWLDTSMCASFGDPRQIESLIRRHNPEQVMLGSDCPWESPERSMRFILDMDLSMEQKEKILAKNAEALFHLKNSEKR